MNKEENILLSYFDKNKDLSAKQHCDMYLNIKKDILAVVTHYPINFTIAGTEVVNNLQQEKDNLIKYLEDKIKEFKDKIEKFDLWHEVGVDLNFLILQKQWYQELLERIKNSNYET